MGGVDYYELLGVGRTASSGEIKSAYRTLAKVMHPDAGGTAGTFRLLQQAYETLVDPGRRAEYDRTGSVDSVAFPGRTTTRPPRRTASRWPTPHPAAGLDEDLDEDFATDDLDDDTEAEEFAEADFDDEEFDDDPDEDGAEDDAEDGDYAVTEDLDDLIVDDPTADAYAEDAGEPPDAYGERGFSGLAGATPSPGFDPVPTERERRAVRAWPRVAPRTGKLRDFGEDPDFVPASPRLDPDTITWWHWSGLYDRVRYLPVVGPGLRPVLLTAVAWVVLLVPLLTLPLPPLVLTGWLVLLAALAFVLVRLVLRYRAGRRVDRDFTAEFGEIRVFGRPGLESTQVAERLTAQLLARYLTKLPGVRIFHGLSWPDSVFADVDHAVLCGRRLVLVESKLWLPGHYSADETGQLWRNGHPFRGGTLRLPGGVAAFRELLPEVEVRGAVLLYPSRSGDITTGESPEIAAPPYTPEQFVVEIGEWLAAEPAAVDRETFRTMLSRVVSAGTTA